MIAKGIPGWWETYRKKLPIVPSAKNLPAIVRGPYLQMGTTNSMMIRWRTDHSVPGVGDGDLSRIPLADRTTPAGRFASQPGRNLSGEAIVWFDYNAALAIHRVRPGASQGQRLERLASGTPADNRASLGCVVVMPEFYDSVVLPTLGQHRGVVYVLPELQPVQAMFGTAQPVAQQR
jgi:hypothetical protein